MLDAFANITETNTLMSIPSHSLSSNLLVGISWVCSHHPKRLLLIQPCLHFIISALALNCCSPWAGPEVPDAANADNRSCSWEFVVYSSIFWIPPLAVTEVQLSSSQITLDSKDLTFPICHICNLVFQYWQQCTLDDTHALRKHVPLAPGTFWGCEMGRMESWNPGRASGVFSISVWDDACLQGRVVWFAALHL